LSIIAALIRLRNQERKPHKAIFYMAFFILVVAQRMSSQTASIATTSTASPNQELAMRGA
jgi:hypothetical protein